MANVTITIPDQLITLYNQARASWNPFIAEKGGVLLPAPTKTALEQLIKNMMKSRVLAEAIWQSQVDIDIDALQTTLNGL